MAETSKPKTAKVEVPASPGRTGASVRWTQGVHGFQERSFAAADWARAGLVTEDNPPTLREGVEPVTWNHANGFSVPASQLDFLSDDEWNRIIVADPDLEVVPGEQKD